jgi:hypothetical protein
LKLPPNPPSPLTKQQQQKTEKATIYKITKS